MRLPGFGAGEFEVAVVEMDLVAAQGELFAPAEAGLSGELGGLAPFGLEVLVEGLAFGLAVIAVAHVADGREPQLVEGIAVDLFVA